MEEKIPEEMEIKREVRQGCILSPLLLLNVYSEEIMLQTLKSEKADEKIES